MALTRAFKSLHLTAKSLSHPQLATTRFSNNPHHFFSSHYHATAKMVQIKTGDKLAEIKVEHSLSSLSKLKEKNPVAFHEFVTRCRDPYSHLSDSTLAEAIDLNLIQAKTSRIPHYVRSIVLSAVRGDHEMYLTSPLVDEEHENTNTLRR